MESDIALSIPALADNDWLIGGGEMAKLIKAKDWSQTPLGPIESWPQSLRTVVSLAQASNSPISLSWGPEQTLIYNDGYWPICGEKHPTSLGQDFRECWVTAWPVIGEAHASACAGKTAYLENMRMFLDRYGFLEETWFTFSLSPITDETGNVAGLFNPVTELTGQSLSERRTKTLRDLAAIAGKCKTAKDTLAECSRLLAESDLDVPFALFYWLDETGRSARLMAQTGMGDGVQGRMPAISVDPPEDNPWHIDRVFQSNQPEQIDNVDAVFKNVKVGPYAELPKTAISLPLNLPGHSTPAGVLVLGTSSRLRLDEPYRGFLDIVAASVSTALANAMAHEDERRKAEALAEIDRAKTEFFSNVSHEFRTPLTLMLAPLEDELAEQDHPLPPARRDRIETAHRNSLRLLKLVNGLLDFSRIEAGRAEARYQPTDLATLTKDLASSFRSAIERGGLTLTVDCPPLPESVYVDREMWEKIVLNLLSNAFKHTFFGSIDLRLSWVDDAPRLTVNDSGVGIAEGEIPKLFDRFHRVVGAASRTHEGTGIGLSLVHELVALHGGKISVESEVNRGTCFTVWLKAGSEHLPADRLGSLSDGATMGQTPTAYIQEALSWLPNPTDSDQSVDPNSVVEDVSPTDCSHAKHRPRIVWADDNADMRQYVSRLLSGSYDVITVSDGQAALEAALDAAPDLMLSDVMMPRLDGFGLLKAIRADERTNRIPVILLSARAGEESAVEGLEAGADDYLVKPFSAKELLARIRAALSLVDRRREWEAKLSEANLELAEAAEAKGRFLANMSHEIRTPLNAVIGMAGLLVDTPLSEEQLEFANIIRMSGDHLLTVINDILDYSKLESGNLIVERIPFNVATIVEEGLEMVSAQARAKFLELAYEVAPDVPTAILGDPGRVRQVLLNFLSNAVKFTGEGEVVVTVSHRAGLDGVPELVFAIRDTGIGLTAEQFDRLFQPFSQADLTTSRKYGGTGLGLAISRKLAELMGGTAWVESQIGMGATFSFSIAAIVPDQASRVRWKGRSSAPLAGLLTWIVDDNDTNRCILRRQAESWGLVVRDTALPAEALEWAAKGDACDLTILDFQMPEMDGAALAAELYRIRGNSIKQVMLSSVGIVLATDEAKKIGLIAQLTKPVRHSALFNSIVKLFEFKSTQAIASVSANALPSDLATRLPLRILVAEDNAVNVKLITIILKRLGYRADIAGNGLEAIEALRRQSYDVLLMDVQMPEMDGIEATRQICMEWQPGERPRIVALTAGVMPEERLRCLDAGMEDFLNKPVDSTLLVDALGRCRRREAMVEPMRLAPNQNSPGFDSEAFELLLQNFRVQDVQDLVEVFLEDAPRQIANMRAAVSAADPVSFARAVHSVKVVPSMLGAIGFASVCSDLEDLARINCLDRADQKLSELELMLAKTANFLKGLTAMDSDR